jgi:hypothetical protein
MGNENTIRVKVSRPSQGEHADSGRRAEPQRTETVELELVSTQALNIMLTSSDAIEREAIEEVAKMNEQGVLARDPQGGNFEIIDDAELQAILDSNRDLPKTSQPAEISLVPANDADNAEFSLVSTLALRKVLQKPSDENKPSADIEPGGSFDPYNSN